MNKIIYPLAKETINEADVDALCTWLKTYPRLTKGDLTIQFEKEWAKYIGTKHACFCNSGSSANLLMTYIAKQFAKNNKIIVPSVAWVTTIAPAIQFGLEPIMIGADPYTYGMDLDQLEKVCEIENPGIVIFVQVLGVPHFKERLLALKDKYGFILLEDGCAALGAEYADGTKVGAVGDMASFSFYFGHQLSTIEGGMVNTNDKRMHDALMMYRSHGWGKDLDEQTYDKLINASGVDDFHKPFYFFVPGFNLRSTDLQAFIGLRQVQKANWVSERRYENHLRYAANLEGHLSFQSWFDNKPVSISFGALADSGQHRKEIVERLVKHGVETRLFSAGNLGKHLFWKTYKPEFKDKVSDMIHERGFFLPNYPEMTEEDIDYISRVVLDLV